MDIFEKDSDRILLAHGRKVLHQRFQGPVPQNPGITCQTVHMLAFSEVDAEQLPEQVRARLPFG
jgi:hypothetical protein